MGRTIACTLLREVEYDFPQRVRHTFLPTLSRRQERVPGEPRRPRRASAAEPPGSPVGPVTELRSAPGPQVTRHSFCGRNGQIAFKVIA